MKSTRHLGIAALSFLVIAVWLFMQHDVWAFQPSLSLPAPDSPLPTPTPLPVAITDISPEAQLALNYLAEQQKIEPRLLAVVGEQPAVFPTLGLTYTLVTIIYDQPSAFQSFGLLVDPVSGEIARDYNAVHAAEQEAYRRKYGKLHPELYELLQTAADDEKLPVAIWVAPSSAVRSEAELAEEFIKLHPEAEKPWLEQGMPWAVDDPKLHDALKIEWRRLQIDELSKGNQPIVDWLKARGYSDIDAYGTPSVTATVSKLDILALARMEGVDQIYFVGHKTVPASNVAVPTDRIPALWARNITGVGVAMLAILETGKINGQATACLNVVGVRDSSLGDSIHKSRVAAVAACNDNSLKGVAPGVQMLDAGHVGTETEARNALVWAINHGADVVNYSEHVQTDTQLYYLDRVFDYHVRSGALTAVVAAGNEGNGTGNITTPAKAWNVIAVGNVEDKNTPSWSDDDMRSGSSYNNPSTQVEKPEVAAPGTDINTVAGQDTGTSFSAPQVAGLAALLMNAAPTAQLQDWPSAIKAILLASSVHNIEGDSRLSSRDGAGAIDAALAYQTVQTLGPSGWPCTSSCWWYISTSNTNPGLNGIIERTFAATRGERIRVAIAWLSQANGTYTTDSLRTNYDLYVRQSSNNAIISYAVDQYSNYEIVEFVAPVTGNYKIEVLRNGVGDQNESSNRLGIALSRQATYLPDVRSDSAGWNRNIYIRNDGAEQRNVRTTFFTIDGNFSTEANSSFLPEKPWINPQPNPDFAGSAVVDGSEELSAIATVEKTVGNASRGAYMGINSLAAAATLYVPLAQRKAPTASGPANTEIMVQNISGIDIIVSIQMIGAPGVYGNYTKDQYINAGGSYRYQLVYESPNNLPDGWYGSAVLSATTFGGKIAAVVNLFVGNDTVQTYNAFPLESLSTEWVAPLFASRLTNGLSTPVTVQNLSDNPIPANALELNCIKDPASQGDNTFTRKNGISIDINGTFTFNPVTDAGIPNNWYGACWVKTTNGANIVAIVQMRNTACVGCIPPNTANAAAYEAIPANSQARTLAFPIVQKRLADGSATVITVQNLNKDVPANVIFRYSQQGCTDPSCYSSVGPYSIPAKGSIAHNHRLLGSGSGTGQHNLPEGWTGTLMVYSLDQPIGGFAQLTNINIPPNPPGDTTMAHNAIAR